MFKKIENWLIETPNGWADFSGIQKNDPQQLFEIQLDDGCIIAATKEHGFYINNELVKMKDLKINDILDAKPTNKTIINITISNVEEVYDIVESKDGHKFLIDNGIITKNCDEFAFVPQNIAEDFWIANYPTLSTGGACIVVSTPNGTANYFYTLWKNAIDKKNTFNPIRIDYHEVPIYDEKWKEATIKDIGKIKFAQEYGNQFQGSSITLIDAEFIINHLKWEEPLITPDDYTKMWGQPKPNHKYLISIDTGGGVGSDNSIMNIFDITNYPATPAEQVGIWCRNDYTPPKFSEMVHDSALYWNNAYIIGEINGLSNEVLTRIMEMEYENVYFDYDDETYGIYATKTSKPRAAMWFKEELEGIRILIKDSETIEELGYFEEVSPGVYKAKVGRNFHDDRVMTCLWAAYFLKSKYFEDEKDSWSIKPSDGLNENNLEEQSDPDAEAALEAFLDNDKKEHGEDWLDKDEFLHG